MLKKNAHQSNSAAKSLAQTGHKFTVTEEFEFFLKNDFELEDFRKNQRILESFLSLDDFDIWGAIKLWKRHEDYVLRNISQMFLTRNLFKINLVNEAFSPAELQEMKAKTLKKNYKYRKPISIISFAPER